MNRSTPRGTKMLLVEGDDEVHTLPKLIGRHVPWGPRAAEWPAVIKGFGGVEALLAEGAIAAELKAPGVQAVGVLLDADEDAAGRFASVARRVQEAEPGFSGTLTDGGVVWVSPAGLKIGVWVMPDNAATGMLETFLAHVVGPEQSSLFELATTFVDEAKAEGADFRERHRDKARIHAYLATRDRPGRPLGIATAAGAFDGENELRRRFLTWFTELFEPTPEP